MPSARLRGDAGEALLLPACGRRVIYTSCLTLYLTLRARFARIHEGLVRAGTEATVQLLSVSFDPTRDDARVLRGRTEPTARIGTWSFQKALAHRGSCWLPCRSW